MSDVDATLLDGKANINILKSRIAKTFHEYLNNVFREILESTTREALAGNIHVLECFAILVYDRTSNYRCINEARKELFTKKARTTEALPPTSAALTQHFKRVAFQTKQGMYGETR